MATRTGFEPVISALTGQYVSRYTTGPQGKHLSSLGSLPGAVKTDPAPVRTIAKSAREVYKGREVRWEVC